MNSAKFVQTSENLIISNELTHKLSKYNNINMREKCVLYIEFGRYASNGYFAIFFYWRQNWHYNVEPTC